MGLNVNQSIRAFAIFILLSTIGCNAQVNFENKIQFNHKRGNRSMSLHRFLSNIDVAQWKGESCFEGLETFHFSVDLNGKITEANHEGNLPNFMVMTMKEKINSLNDKWLIKKDTSISSFTFKVLLLVDVRLSDECSKTKFKYSDFLEKDYGKDAFIKLSDNSYELKPVSWSSIK